MAGCLAAADLLDSELNMALRRIIAAQHDERGSDTDQR